MKAKFIKVVDEADVVSARIFLANELMLDPRGKTFNEMKSYAESRLHNLYEQDNGVTYETDESRWDETFLFNLKNDLDSNFSRERLDFYETVIRVVMSEKAELLDREEAAKKDALTASKERVKSSDKQDPAYNKKDTYTRLTAGSAVVALAGICFSKTVLTTLGVVGVIVGGVLLYNESKK